jgi:hypothetical protein
LRQLKATAEAVVSKKMKETNAAPVEGGESIKSVHQDTRLQKKFE